MSQKSGQLWPVFANMMNHCVRFWPVWWECVRDSGRFQLGLLVLRLQHSVVLVLCFDTVRDNRAKCECVLNLAVVTFH